MSSGRKVCDVWKSLNGLLCVYKPSGKYLPLLKKKIKIIASKGLQQCEADPPRKIVRLDYSFEEPVYVIDTDYSDHPLVIGPRYLPNDVRVSAVNQLGNVTSGVLVLGINDGIKPGKELRQSKPLTVYHVSGRLGVRTPSQFIDDKFIERATVSHIYRANIDKVLSAMQANYQRAMFIQCGVSLQTQAAYELALKGLIRPGNDNVPTLYGMKCIHFDRPFFTIEVTCINETEPFLLELIDTIGHRCRSVATCTKVRCVRYGPFSVNHALLQHKWNVENIVENMKVCTALDVEDKKTNRRERAEFVRMSQLEDAEKNVTSREGAQDSKSVLDPNITQVKSAFEVS